MAVTMRIRWLEKALCEVAEITEYMGQDDVDTAKNAVSCIRERIAGLAHQPNQGRPGRVTGTREPVMDKYPFIIPYRVRGEEVHILRVFHTSQKPPQKW